MKSFFKDKNFWIAVACFIIVPAFVIANKVAGWNFSVGEIVALISSISGLAAIFIGSDKFSESKILAKKIELNALKYGAPLAETFEIIASKSDKGKKAVEDIKKIIEESKEIKNAINDAGKS